MTKKYFKTGQNGQKRPNNHLKVPEKGLELAKITKIPLKSPENDQKSLKNGSKWPKTLRSLNGPPGFLGGFR